MLPSDAYELPNAFTTIAPDYNIPEPVLLRTVPFNRSPEFMRYPSCGPSLFNSPVYFIQGILIE